MRVENGIIHFKTSTKEKRMEKSKGSKMKKPKKEKPFLTSMRIPVELHREIKSEAALQGLSMRKWIIDIIESHLADVGKKV